MALRTVAVLAASVLLVSTGVAIASQHSKKSPRTRYQHRYVRKSGRIYDRPDANGWFPRDANRLKVGSAIWWEQMEREGRVGRPFR